MCGRAKPPADRRESRADRHHRRQPSLLLQKDYLIKEVHHRVQNSLQLVSSFLSLQGRAIGDATLSKHLAEAQRRLSAVAMVHRRLHSDDQIQAVDMYRYITDLCGEIASTMDQRWSDQINLDLANILFSTDRAVSVGLILTELIINANKYAYGGGSGPITIALEQHRNQCRLTVADKGTGKTGDREGFGSRMLQSIIKSLSGSMQEVSNDPGLRVIVTVPIQVPSLAQGMRM